MRVQLHGNLGVLAALTGSGDGQRVAFSAVLLREQNDGLYRADATDGRRLAIVQGPLLDGGSAQLPEGDDVSATLVPGADWKAAFGRPGKKLTPVGVCTSGETVTLRTAGATRETRIQEGCFPPTDRVLPDGPPLCTIPVDGLLLAELLRAAVVFSPDGAGRVSLLYFGRNKPLGLATSNEHGQAFDALLVPLATDPRR